MGKNTPNLLLILTRRIKKFKNFKQSNAVLLFSYHCLSFIKSYIKTQLVCLKVLAWRQTKQMIPLKSGNRNTSRTGHEKELACQKTSKQTLNVLQACQWDRIPGQKILFGLKTNRSDRGVERKGRKRGRDERNKKTERQ